MQAAIEKRSSYVLEIVDPVVDDLDYPEFEEMFVNTHWILVGDFNLYTLFARCSTNHQLVRKVNPNACIVLGGPHCAMFPEYAMGLEGIDAILTGDGEDAFLEIVQRFDKGEDFAGILVIVVERQYWNSRQK